MNELIDDDMILSLGFVATEKDKEWPYTMIYKKDNYTVQYVHPWGQGNMDEGWLLKKDGVEVSARLVLRKDEFINLCIDQGLTEDYTDCWRQKYNSSLSLHPILTDLDGPIITRTKLTPVRIDFICPKCGNGKLQRVHKHHMLPDNAPYLHKCDKCDHQEQLKESYPHIIYEETSL